MKRATKELEVVNYTAAAIKVKTFIQEDNTLCFALHWHDRLEIIRVKKGELTVEIGDEIYTLKSGQMIIFPPRMAHKGYTQNCFVDYDVLMFNIRSFYNETTVCNQTLPLIFEGRVNFKKVITDIETLSLCDKICNNQNPDSLEIVSLIYNLLFNVFQKHILEIRPKTQEKSRQIIDYIETNYNLYLNTAILSKKFGYSTEHFCRKFKETTGITPMTYLKIYRLEKSLKMLKSGENNISEIASRCGFSDANYFTRCFKSHYGVPPKQYKNNVKIL